MSDVPHKFVQQTSTNSTFGSEVLTVGSLAISDPNGSTNGGVLDLGNGDMIVQDTAASTIQPLLAAGYDGGAWDGLADSGPNPASIISSGAANDPYQIESLGYAQIGSDTGDGGLDLSTFDGKAVSSGDTVVELTYYGDANLDRTVNSTDEGMIGEYYPYTGTAIGGWTGGDFNYDGEVNLSDNNLFDNSATVLAGTGQNKAEVKAVQTNTPGASVTATVTKVQTSTGAQATQGTSLGNITYTNPQGATVGPTVNGTPTVDANGDVSVNITITGCTPGTYVIELSDGNTTVIDVTVVITAPK